MKEYLDDRMYVVCLAKLKSESLIDNDARIIDKNFANIENKTFYTESGIVRNGEYSIGISYQLNEEAFKIFNSQKFNDDILGIYKSVTFNNKYAVLTFKNVNGYPPVRDDVFDSLEEAVEYIRTIIPDVPLVSLEGKPCSFTSDEEYRSFIIEYNMIEFFEK